MGQLPTATIQYPFDGWSFGQVLPSTAMVAGIPVLQYRRAFMSINTSLQQIAGEVGAAVAGTIVVQKGKFSPLENFPFTWASKSYQHAEKKIA